MVTGTPTRFVRQTVFRLEGSRPDLQTVAIFCSRLVRTDQPLRDWNRDFGLDLLALRQRRDALSAVSDVQPLFRIVSGLVCQWRSLFVFSLEAILDH
jgi:hypothetical protein